MNNQDIQIVKKEYTTEGLVQKLALMKIQAEIDTLNTREIGEKFQNYCDVIRAYIH